VYAEARSPADVDALLGEGSQIADEARGAPRRPAGMLAAAPAAD
jgi:hypothetical protein